MASGDMTPERFAALLDAYGGDPARWPDAEREQARALLDRSADARARRGAAAALDALLDRATTLKPSRGLAERILAEAPTPRVVPLRRPLRGRIAAVVGLAAAASLALWLVHRPSTPPTLEQAALGQLGEYQTPTDALLSAADLDTGDTMPEFGCDDPEVDCDDSDVAQARSTAALPAADQRYA
jgi:hypothetical protein